MAKASDETITYEPVIVKDVYGAENPSKVKVITRTPSGVLKRAAKRSGKIVGAVILILPIAIFVHLLLVLGALALLVAIGLFFWGLGDHVTFENVEGVCPKCKINRTLKPFSAGRLKYPLKVHCGECGEVFQAVQVAQG